MSQMIEVIKPFVFELSSIIGRYLLNKKPPKINSLCQMLHLGCGTFYFEGWVNADFFLSGINICVKAKKVTPDWKLDFRYPLNCNIDYWDGIFTEHTIEHLTYHEAENLMRELYRVLKPNRWIRIILPDFKKYVHNYLNFNSSHKNFRQWNTRVEAVSSLTQEYGHKSVWDAASLIRLLDKVGFHKINEVNFQEGSDNRIIKDCPDRVWESFYVEAQK